MAKNLPQKTQHVINCRQENPKETLTEHQDRRHADLEKKASQSLPRLRHSMEPTPRRNNSTVTVCNDKL